MLGVTLTACGLVTLAFGTWRGNANGREARASLARGELLAMSLGGTVA